MLKTEEDEDSPDEEDESEVQKREDEKRRESALMENNPKEAAESMARVLAATKKELRMTKRKKDELAEKMLDLKSSLDELRRESRLSVEKQMRDETLMHDLRIENAKMEAELRAHDERDREGKSHFEAKSRE